MDRDRFLTERQKEILDFIGDFQGRHGFTPTHREICERFGYSSYGTVYKHLRLLREKGYLRRSANQKRGIELTSDSGVRSGALQLPFLNQIAAGQPIEAVAGDETIAVPEHMVSARKGVGHYVLRVAGDSMIGEGIFDGDYVVVEHREQASPGDMVVALVGDEATLKRFYPEGPTVRLQPANPAMEPLRVAASDVRVQGIVVGLMRRF